MSQKSANMARRLFAAVPTQHPLPHKEKEKSPHTPLKEKEISPAPVPVPEPFARTRTGAGAAAHGPASRSGSGAVDIRQDSFGSGSGAEKRVKVDHDFIMNPAYDPVQIALLVLGIPKLTPGHNNARLMRWAIRTIGEEVFRDLVYRQWRENSLDGSANNAAAAFQAKLNNAVSAMNGGAA
jgi:hypothetical protein